jgi:hypothetical protein
MHVKHPLVEGSEANIVTLCELGEHLADEFPLERGPPAPVAYAVAEAHLIYRLQVVKKELYLEALFSLTFPRLIFFLVKV